MAMIAGIVALDVHTDAEFSLSAVYLIPVVFASWYGNRAAGLIVSLAGSLSWFLIDVSERESVHAWWETGARLGTYALVAGALSRLHEERRTAARLHAALERKAEERSRELQDRTRELKTVTYVMAHDLRAPLRAVHGFSDVLRDDHAAALGPAGNDCLRRISAAAVQMDDLIGDLLHYARLIHEPVSPEPVRFDAAVAAALRAVTRDLSDRRAAVVIDRPTARVLAHRSLLAEVLRRLLLNAVRHVRGEPRIRIRAERRNGWVRLWVEDNGVGIAPEHQERIFQPGERLEPGGSGMGLAFARRAMERMHGRVGVESQVGEGSRFWLDLRPAPPS